MNTLNRASVSTIWQLTLTHQGWHFLTGKWWGKERKHTDHYSSIHRFWPMTLVGEPSVQTTE